MEDLKDPLIEIASKLKSIVFYNSKCSFNNVLAYINISGPNYVIKAKDIEYLNFKLYTDKEKYISEILNSDIEIKILLNIEI